MNVGFYAAKVQAQLMRHRENIEYAYERYPDTTKFWALVDLVSSSNYRLVKGPGKGYVRGETFFGLIGEVIRPYSEIEVLKEIGDASLLSADSLRPLLEGLILADQVALEMRLLAGDEQFPFAVRSGIGYGPVKRLTRPGKPNDYLGSPLDQLARILGIRDSDAQIYLHEAAYQSQEAIVAEYGDFLSVSSPKSLSSEKSKGMLQPIYYRELRINRPALREFRQYFAPWREGR